MPTSVDGATMNQVTVTSTSVPVSLIPPGFKYGGWGMIAWPTNTPIVLVFPYIGTIPATWSADTWPLASGAVLNDNIFSAASGADLGLSVGWGAILQSGATATVTAYYR